MTLGLSAMKMPCEESSRLRSWASVREVKTSTPGCWREDMGMTGISQRERRAMRVHRRKDDVREKTKAPCRQQTVRHCRHEANGEQAALMRKTSLPLHCFWAIALKMPEWKGKIGLCSGSEGLHPPYLVGNNLLRWGCDKRERSTQLAPICPEPHRATGKRGCLI